MKKILVAFLLFVCWFARAADMPASLAFNPLPITLLSTSATATNAASSAYRIDWPLNHTIQVFNTGASNATVAIDRSLFDPPGTNWINIGTNTVNTGKTYETNFVGKYTWLQVRTYVTNSTISILYLGGR